jgi:predicted outer membrane protein
MTTHGRGSHGATSNRNRMIAVGAAMAAVVAGAGIWVSQADGGSQSVSDSGMPSAHGGAGAAAAPGAEAANSGPVSELDKTFLVKVRQAGLWEIPAGRMAQNQASSEAIKRAGMHLLDGHSKLDQLVREDAKALSSPIPDEASAEQQQWVEQMKNADGEKFDQLFVDLLRASHGKIFITIGEVRAATKNHMIRRLAKVANNTVMDHMEVLEDTGLLTDAVLDDVAASVPK